MLNFSSDYTNCACNNILQRLINENETTYTGYGTDDITKEAVQKIRKACNVKQANVQFVSAGTQANALVLSAILSRCGAVISAHTGHINVHEAGAIEARGHKVLAINTDISGKLYAGQIKQYMQTFLQDETAPHMTQPEVVYISQPTEHGFVYTKNELLALRAVCDEYNLKLFADGARLSYALAASDNDASLEVLAKTCDIFYIGATKTGALFGEAIVYANSNLCKNFFTLTKQHGALLAKGFVLGIQFDELFTNDLYIKLAQNAIDCATEIRAALKQKQYKMLCDNTTNQIFVIMQNEKLNQISKSAKLQVWQPISESETAVRIATSWATKKSDVERLIKLL